MPNRITTVLTDFRTDTAAEDHTDDKPIYDVLESCANGGEWLDIEEIMRKFSLDPGNAAQRRFIVSIIQESFQKALSKGLRMPKTPRAPFTSPTLEQSQEMLRGFISELRYRELLATYRNQGPGLVFVANTVTSSDSGIDIPNQGTQTFCSNALRPHFDPKTMLYDGSLLDLDHDRF